MTPLLSFLCGKALCDPNGCTEFLLWTPPTLTTDHFPPCLTGHLLPSQHTPHPRVRVPLVRFVADSSASPPSMAGVDAPARSVGWTQMWLPGLWLTTKAVVWKVHTPHRERCFITVPGIGGRQCSPQRERKYKELSAVPKRTGVTRENSPSETWFFICTLRGLDWMGSRDYGKGSRAWFSQPDSPGCGCCSFYRVSCAALYPHSPLWVPLLGCKMGWVTPDDRAVRWIQSGDACTAPASVAASHTCSFFGLRIPCPHPLVFWGVFWPCYTARGTLVPWPEIESTPPAVKVWSLNPWTTREVSLVLTLD